MFSRTNTYSTVEVGTPTLINWRAVFGGAVIGLGILTLLSALWLAMAFPSDSEVVRDNLQWFLGGTAIFALFLAGLIAGYSSGARGLGAGVVQALTLWSLVTVLTLAVGVPSAMNALGLRAALGGDPFTGPLWATFWSMLIALGATLLGGMIGGALPRRSVPSTGIASEPHGHADAADTQVEPATRTTTRRAS